MAFSVRPLKFSRVVLAGEPTGQATGRDAAIVEIIREVEKDRSFLLSGARGRDKTSLLNQVSFYFNSQVDHVVALGPLSLARVSQDGLNSLGTQLRDWFRNKETSLISSLYPKQVDSLNAWVPLLRELINRRKSDTLLLLLDDLDSVALEDRETILRDIQNSSWAKIATRTVLGCAGNFAENEISIVTGAGLNGNYASDELVSIAVTKSCAVELLNAMIINLGIAPPGKKQGKGKGSGGGSEPPAPGKPPGRYVGSGRSREGGERSSEKAIDDFAALDRAYPQLLPNLALASALISAVMGKVGKDSVVTVEESTKLQKEDVDATVYAPFEAWPGKRFLVQVFAHRPKETGPLEEIAKQAAPEGKRRVGGPLSKQIQRGSELTFNLIMKELEIDEPSQSCIWRGERELVQFEVTVPNDLKPVDVFGRVEVSQNSVPIGRLRFELKIVKEASTADVENVPAGILDRYKQAFISYSSKDRLEVFKRIQMLDALGPAYFMDQLTLRRGARWEKELYKYLDQSDVVYLFWSKAASKSPWVTKEIEYARKRQAGNNEAPPAIVPIPLEGPKKVKPPAKLSFLHFDDRFLYFIKGEEVLAKQSRRKRAKTRLKP